MAKKNVPHQPRIIAVNMPAPNPPASPDVTAEQQISSETITRYIATAWMLGDVVAAKYIDQNPEGIASAVLKMQLTLGVVRITVDKEVATHSVFRVDDKRAPFFGELETKEGEDDGKG